MSDDRETQRAVPAPVMYDTCLHCQARFGRNEAIEAFPVGGALAYDEAKGRLWVICAKCARWNLVPIDRRWEAIEACERAFRGTTRRVSTGEVALARLADGTRLVRIGAPRLPEYAAWRYGDQVAARRRKTLARGFALGAAATGGVALTVPALAAIGGGVAGLLGAMSIGLLQSVVVGGALAASGGVAGLAVAPVPLQDAEGRWVVPIKNSGYRFVADAAQPEGWGIRLQAFGFSATPPSYLELALRNNGLAFGTPVTIGGEHARAALVRLLPRVNAAGAPPKRVEGAVRTLEAAGLPHEFLPHLARNLRPWIMRQHFGDSGDITAFPPELRLAMEMAVHDEVERAAMEGELRLLEAAWREAEAIAAIADRLLVPPAADEKLDALRRTRDAR